ncbi:ABC transporter substrate-binding protein [Kineococcus glutinatus]|uniref:ABC transporter substrate-binding protein n=1 Tax=Kineococcus glutinatus TaxID=1070872 RepID=A0ABP9HXY2_9ACTN
MTRPRTEAEHLASLVPASVRATRLPRRSVLRGSVLAAGALGGLTACGGDDAGSGGEGGGSATTLGSNGSDEVPKKMIAALAADAKTKAGVDVAINTIEHEKFQEGINNYLQGSPDDVWTWFSGYRMRFFASRGLAGDISDVWQDLTGYTDAFKQAGTGDDGKQYLVPSTYGPWAVFYRKSLWQERGYTPPADWESFKALLARMQTDGLVPMAFADKDGWPAMGTFDQLNLRINGYQFHVDLMAGEEAWNSAEVKSVFEAWREIMPFHQEAANGREWQEAATALVNKEAGMMLLGSFIGEQFPEADQGDLDFFNFPEIDPAIGADAVEAPLDGYMMSARPRDEEAAKKFLGYLGSADAGTLMVQTNPTVITANGDTDTSGYTELQARCAEYVGSAKSIAQFMDRDTRPDFASTVMIPSLQTFINNPADIDGLVNSIEEQKKSIFTS